MIKKALVMAIAAAALSVPLAGVAGADPSPTNPGTPGNFGVPGVATSPPGAPSSTVNTVSNFAHAKAPGVSLPQQNSGVSPGQTIKTFAPGQEK